jgi:hypothetical protein
VYIESFSFFDKLPRAHSVIREVSLFNWNNNIEFIYAGLLFGIFGADGMLRKFGK